jgi:co-chaperonin GroES (HSP10)
MNGSILKSKVLVRPFAVKESKTSSGIIIPEISRPSQTGGTVILTGDPDSQAKIGNKVLFSPHAFQQVVIEEEDLMLVDHKDLLFIY